MKAFVAGATGETGRRIVQQLIGRNIPVRALVRDVEKARMFNAFFASVFNTDEWPWDPWSPVLED